MLNLKQAINGKGMNPPSAPSAFPPSSLTQELSCKKAILGKVSAPPVYKLALSSKNG
jgi:hypothetical protein